MALLFLLYESPLGFALFEKIQADELALNTPEMESALSDVGLFCKLVKLRAFKAFESSASALEALNQLAEGECSDQLVNFLSENLPAFKKKSGDPDDSKKKKRDVSQLGVVDKVLGSSIKARLGLDCVADDLVFELLRGIRQHASKLIGSDPSGKLLAQAQLGLAHSYSRNKVKFNVHRADNMIIQSSCLLDTLDKDLNTANMRLREWYGWHFPELSRLIPEVGQYARCVLVIGDKNNAVSLESLEDALESNVEMAKLVLEAIKTSMGSDMSDMDVINLRHLAERVVSMSEYRNGLQGYLSGKMQVVAPNLTELIGQTIGARLISKAGSLSNLAKYPASTVQILGAEKALFRSLKSRDGKTPKYGLLYHSAAITKASSSRDKGRISRYLANKCSLASRIDCFSEIVDAPVPVYGKALKKQVEARLQGLLLSNKN
jgi:nucleolar protein 56